MIRLNTNPVWCLKLHLSYVHIFIWGSPIDRLIYPNKLRRLDNIYTIYIYTLGKKKKKSLAQIGKTPSVSLEKRVERYPPLSWKPFTAMQEIVRGWMICTYSWDSSRVLHSFFHLSLYSRTSHQYTYIHLYKILWWRKKKRKPLQSHSHLNLYSHVQHTRDYECVGLMKPGKASAFAPPCDTIYQLLYTYKQAHTLESQRQPTVYKRRPAHSPLSVSQRVIYTFISDFTLPLNSFSL